MKQRFTLFLVLSWISLAAFGQAYTGFTPAQKPERPERPSGYHALLDTYKALQQNTLQKSTSDLSTYLDTAQTLYYLGNDQYLPVMNQIITYDVSGNMTRVKVIGLNNPNQWEDYSLTELSYDAGGNITLETYEGWNDNFTAWIRSKTEYSYDASNKLVEILEYAWSESLAQFINSRKVFRTINESGLETQALVSLWVAPPGEWVDTFKYEYNYDANDALLLETEFTWDNGAMDWALSWKAENTYGENDKLSVTEEFNWDSQSSSWSNFWKTILTYDASENVDQRVDSKYLEPDGPWQDQWKGIYTFDEQNNPLSETYSLWDEATTQWALYRKFEHVYDQGTFLSELVVPHINWFAPDYREQIVSKPLGYVASEYSTETSELEIWYQEVYLYNEHFPTNVPGSEASRIASLFPNPSREYITISFAGDYHQVSFELYDVTGRTVIHKRVENGERVNLENLQNGIYFYRISAKQQIQTGKLMKK